MAIASTTLIQILIRILSARVLSAMPGVLPASGSDGVFLALRNFASQFAHVAAPVAVTALWQGAVVAAGLALCMRLAPRVGAAHRFAAWAAGFGVLVGLPFVPAFSRLLGRLMASNSGPGAGSDIGAASLPSSTTHAWMAHPWLQISDRWSLAIAALWVLMALARSIDLGIHTARLRRLWKNAAPIAAALPPALALDGNARQAPFELCATRELDRPSVIGFFAPRILIPEWLLERLSPQELGQVVLHEAEHLRRRDDWTNLVQKLCLVVFPLNPALVFVERRLCREREMACDEGVVRRTQAPRAYAACLAGLAERHMEHKAGALSLGARAKALTLSAFERRPELARRVHSILVRRSAIDPTVSRALVGAVGCALVVGAVALARCPQLVAFVPAEPKVKVETAQLVPEQLRGDKVIAPAASHFRAVNAMAIMPETTQQRSSHCQTGLTKAAYRASLRASELNYRQTLVNAQANSARQDSVADAVNSDTPIPQELIVLTAYEQVQAAGDELGDRVVSDNGPNTTARPVDGSTGRVTVTRLIFRVYAPTAGARESDGPNGSALPSGSYTVSAQKQPRAITTSATSAAAVQSTNGTMDKPSGPNAGKLASHAAQPDANSIDANSLTGQPHAVALGNGWFVIQL